MKKQSVSTTKNEEKVELVEINSTMTREQVLKNLLDSLKKQGFKITNKSISRGVDKAIKNIGSGKGESTVKKKGGHGL